MRERRKERRKKGRKMSKTVEGGASKELLFVSFCIRCEMGKKMRRGIEEISAGI
jgi:hypothetical protein